MDLPVKLTPDMNHLVLSQRFAKLITLRSVPGIEFMTMVDLL
jgi:hypothetical protein